MKRKLLTLNTSARADLELPLGGHDLGIGTGDLDTSEQASLVVSLDNISAEDLASTDTTVVWALWTWEPVCWPAIGTVAHVEKSVLLLKTEPRLLRLVGLHKLGSFVAVVELVWGSVGIPALGNNQDVGGTTEWIGEEGDGAEVNIGVVTWSLSSRATVKVPFWEILNLEFATLRDAGKSLKIVGISRACCSNSAGWEGGRMLRVWLTFDLERTPPWESIQMYLDF